jgi:putative sigma-54 modulation protein
MEEKNVQVSFIGMEPTDALKKYVLEKILKKEELLEDVTKIEIFLKQEKYSRGVQDDFRIDINVYMPNTKARVEQIGDDMYRNIDKAADTLFRRLRRYHDQKIHWEGMEPWKVLEADSALEALSKEPEMEIDDYSDYVPKIATKKVIEDMSPMEEGEAIERMELLGYDQFLFRSKKTDKISMVYKRTQGGYGLVEPANGL